MNLDEPSLLWKAALAAFLIEASLLMAVGWNGHWLAHPKATTEASDQFIEAQIFELPPDAQLVEKTKPPSTAKSEATLSKVAQQGRQSSLEENKVPEENQTHGGSELTPTHGPMAVYSPSPHIPSYLQEKELHVSVVIDFFVSALGHATPRLVGSSGNEELDAIAIEAAKKWQFRPAEKDHRPIDAKVRLRILFEVQ
jgi:TonB family protein